MSERENQGSALLELTLVIAIIAILTAGTVVFGSFLRTREAALFATREAAHAVFRECRAELVAFDPENSQLDQHGMNTVQRCISDNVLTNLPPSLASLFGAKAIITPYILYNNAEIEATVRAVTTANLRMIGYSQARIDEFQNGLHIRISEIPNSGRRVDASASVSEPLLLAPAFLDTDRARTIAATAAAEALPFRQKDLGSFPNIVLVIDTSCSMRVRDALAAVQAVITFAPKGVTLAVIGFDVGTHYIINPIELDGPGGANRAQSMLRSLELLRNHNRCETHIPDGIMQAQGLLTDPNSGLPRDPETNELKKTLVALITDGAPNHSVFNKGASQPASINPLWHHEYPTNALMRSHVDSTSGGPCTSAGSNQFGSQRYSFKAAEAFRNDTNVALNVIALQPTNANAKLMRSVANVPAEPGNKANLHCRTVPGMGTENDEYIGQNPSGPEGRFYSTMRDFVDPLNDLIDANSGKSGIPKRVHYLPNPSNLN